MKKLVLIPILTLLSFGLLAQLPESTSIDSLFAKWNFPETPGAALGIVRDGELVYAKGYGSADLEHDVLITPETVFYIGSVSKQFVTFCILLLEEQGKLDLDDRIQQYLPDFPEYDAPLTIRHFIHHTSGVRDYLTLMDLKGRSYLDHITALEAYNLIKRQKELNFTPGERYLYSNSCYFMLAMIVEKASGKPIREFAAENLFGPLGMEHSLFYDDNRDLIKNRAFSYYTKGDEFENLINRFDLVGSGGVYSNIEDLYLWDQNFYDNKLGNGGQAIIEKMQTEGKLNNGESAGYAFALNIGKYRGLKTVSHGGALAGYRSQLLRFPDQRFSVIVLANRGDANPARKCYQVADIMLRGQFAAAEKTPTGAETSVEETTSPPEFTLEQMAGDYEIEPGVMLEIEILSDSLHVVQNWNQADYSLTHHNGNGYKIPGDAGIDFIFSNLQDGKTQTLTVLQNGNETVCTRIDRASPQAVGMEVYAGDYYSEEIDATYHIYQLDGGLRLRIEATEPKELDYYDADLLTSEGMLFRFRRDNGELTGFELDAGRVQNLKFVKN
ncbi:MAG: serine hydrolase domain-containing protein [Robiginitalea sp.]|jgi:CubicO group peptidase (beta-lactamase class C family)